MCGQTRSLSFSIAILISFYVTVVVANSKSTLQLVHVLFRHGDRTPDPKTTYPKDPYANETFYPYGPGELTTKGKQTVYAVGKELRKRYDTFLGEIYTPDIVESWSSNFNRTKMSLQLVLAGLFSPSKEQIWEVGLNWQPIPFNVVPGDSDTLFFGLFCPKFRDQFCELVNTGKLAAQFEHNSDDFNYISEHSGLKVKTYFDVFFLYLNLLTEEEFGLTLPDWTKKVYPEPLKEFASKTYRDVTSTTEFRRRTSGKLLKKIIDDTKAKIQNQSPLKNRKIFLYSGHELNIAHLLHTLEVSWPHIPLYGSYVLFELHKIGGDYGFKIYYQDYSLPEPKLLKMPFCDEFCPLDKFILVMEEYFPEKESCHPKRWHC